ncbi:hypothetical protein FG386_002688 [Cryptosporidium ryanae]|uniref:uncharacterized protein n=1 Tax=Cryptosporidium ryanae TaxID=515981 RepID=UPI003519F725|nr:hypothetical protein FG386_002688 [Cryptosporidium ryanae]
MYYIKTLLKKKFFLSEKTKFNPDYFDPLDNNPKNSCSAQWMLLYTTISSMEENPDEKKLNSMKNFMMNIPDQCKYTNIGDTYSKGIQRYKNSIISAKSKRELILVLCKIENMCRFKLGKSSTYRKYNEILNRWFKRE